MSYRQSYSQPSRRESYASLTNFVRRPSFTVSNYGSGTTGSTGSRYASSKTSGYGTGSSSGYGSSYGGYSGSTSGSSYDSSYSSRTPSYGTGLSSNYGGSTYSSPYGSSSYSGSGAGSGSYGVGTGYSGSSYARPPRDYESGSNPGGGGGNTTSYTSSAYSSRATRDRSAERSLDSIYTPRNSRRSSGSTSDLYSRSGIRKSSSYSGLHWIQSQEEKKHRVVNVNDMIYKSHRRQGSNSSINSDNAFEETKTTTSISRSRESSQREKPPKRDLEAILGKEDHMLVQRIIEENKEIIEETHAKLTSQEEKLIQKIMEASTSGSALDCLDILTIIESH